jgi:hypothetical protein
MDGGCSADDQIYMFRQPLPIPRAYASGALTVGRRDDNMATVAVFAQESPQSSIIIGDNNKTDALRFRLVMWFIFAMSVVINPQ